jgi:hypothetical protein
MQCIADTDTQTYTYEYEMWASVLGLHNLTKNIRVINPYIRSRDNLNTRGKEQYWYDNSFNN